MATTRSIATTVAALLPLAFGQQIGKTPEVHPVLTTEVCTKGAGCKTQQTSVVLDALSHTIQDEKTGASCWGANGGLNTDLCSTAEACATNCVVEGVDYAQRGVQTSADTITLHQYLNGDSVSPRLYLLDESGEEYNLLKLLNQEITFDVDMSNLPCGMNGALYLSEMDGSGGRSDLNPAGASFGTGYCDAQCPVSQWINGVANTNSSGACCNEMDLWEANARATALTPHACTVSGLWECAGDQCGSDGVCDKSGCGYNPYALGQKDYYGNTGNTVDTSRPFTVVTQFLTDDGTATGTLNEIRRVYVQDDEVISNAAVQFNGATINSITNDFCEGSSASFEQRGGLQQMGEAIGRGMVLIFSIWNDAGGYMNWLDSGNAGPCSATEGNPTLIEAQDPSTSVTWSKVRWGDLNTTYTASS